MQPVSPVPVSGARGCRCRADLIGCDGLRQTRAALVSTSRWAARRPWRSRHTGNQLSDHDSQTSHTKWHSEPYGFEIIGRGQNKRKGEIISVFFSPYIDALRTVHLVCCEAVTVSSCLADNMAKGIHLKQRKTTRQGQSARDANTRSQTKQSQTTRQRRKQGRRKQTTTTDVQTRDDKRTIKHITKPVSSWLCSKA